MFGYVEIFPKIILKFRKNNSESKILKSDEIFGTIYHLFEMKSSKEINYFTKVCQSGQGTRKILVKSLKYFF
jgi:ribonucleotide reductase beta subunit family protein with ferritin-like domain